MCQNRILKYKIHRIYFKSFLSIYLISVYVFIKFGMSDYRRVNVIKGISAILILLLGIGLFFAFQGGFFNESFPWILIVIIGGVVVLIISGIMFLPRERINKLSRSHEISIVKDYREYRYPTLKKENKDFIPTQKYDEEISNQVRYCEYCGYQIKTGKKFCTNCGQKLD